MNIEKIDSLFTPITGCLNALQDDVAACFSILKDCWKTEEILATLKETEVIFNASLENHCIGACEKCRQVLLEIFKRLDDVGLDQAFFSLLTARRDLKNLLNKINSKPPTEKAKENICLYQ